MITMSICLPLASKSASEVLAGTQELFGTLRRHGYPVARIHTDAGPQPIQKVVPREGAG